MEELHSDDEFQLGEDIYDQEKVKQKLQLQEITPDFSCSRYAVDEFKSQSRSSRQVAFESIDLATYSNTARLAAFSTSIERVPYWVEGLYTRYLCFLNSRDGYKVKWKELNTAVSGDKCERIVIHVHYNDSCCDILLFAVTVFLTTGRIQVQGKYWQEWANQEMPIMRRVVDKLQQGEPCELHESSFFFCNESDDSNDIQSAKNNVEFITEDSVIMNLSDNFTPIQVPDSELQCEPTCPRQTSTEEPSTETRTLSLNEQENLSPSRINSLNTVRETVSKLEREIVDIRLQFESYVQTNDMSDIRDKLKQVENNTKVNRQKHNEELITIGEENKALRNDLEQVKKTCQKLQDSKSTLAQQVKSLQKELSEQKEAHLSLLKDFKMLKDGQDDENSDSGSESESGNESSEDEVELDKKKEDLSVDTATKPTADNTTNPSINTAKERSQQNKKTQPGTRHQYTHPNSQSHPKEYKNYDTSQDKSLLFLCDSNGKYLRLNRLCPKHRAIYERCPTIETATAIISEIDPEQNTPDVILIHTATNNMESNSDPQHLAEDIYQLNSFAASKFPNTQIIFSDLLPRQDMDVSNVNRLVEESVKQLHNVSIVHHNNLLSAQEPILHDVKHLNRTGVSLFARNLTRALYRGADQASSSTARKNSPHSLRYTPQQTTNHSRPFTTMARGPRNNFNSRSDYSSHRNYNYRRDYNPRRDNNYRRQQFPNYGYMNDNVIHQQEQRKATAENNDRPKTTLYSEAVNNGQPQRLQRPPPVVPPEMHEALKLLQVFFSNY